MRVLILATALASHTIKWVRSLSIYHHVYLFSLAAAEEGVFADFPNVIVESLNIDAKVTTTEGIKGKLKYFKSIRQINRIIKEFKPDILHAHWATSYGLLASLTGFHPYILSVWGADVYDFPRNSILHKKMIEFNFKKADIILSTSKIMAGEILKYTNKNVCITPFGIDIEKFHSYKADSLFDDDTIVVGTIKTLEIKYGINYLIESFAKVKKALPEVKLKLLIVGGGSEESNLKNLVKDLSIDTDVIFTGKISHDKVVDYYNMLDIYVAVSIFDSESFGVAILEAGACEKPVIVSSVGGLPEVVENGKTGIIVPPKDINATVNAMIKLIQDKSLRKEYGKNGRQRVIENYFWDENVNQMNLIYKKALKK